MHMDATANTADVALVDIAACAYPGAVVLSDKAISSIVTRAPTHAYLVPVCGGSKQEHAQHQDRIWHLLAPAWHLPVPWMVHSRQNHLLIE